MSLTLSNFGHITKDLRGTMLRIRILLFAISVLLTTAIDPTAPPDPEQTTPPATQPNVLFLISDQYRWDTLGFVQNRLPRYSNALKVKTPNLDALAASGVEFRTAYCQSPSCGPARASLKTGTTIHRNGVLSNLLAKDRVSSIMPAIEQRIKALESYEQILSEDHGYWCESYGKVHVPVRLLYTRDGSAKVIRYNEMDMTTFTPGFVEDVQFKSIYQQALDQVSPRTATVKAAGQQKTNDFSKRPYYPIKFDEEGICNECGLDTLGKGLTSSAIVGKMGINALHRIASYNKPFVLQIGFSNPHREFVGGRAFEVCTVSSHQFRLITAPMIAAQNYRYYYYRNRRRLVVPSTFNKIIPNTAYSFKQKGSLRRKKKFKNEDKALRAPLTWSDRLDLQEMTGLYYALVQEVDEWVGLILQTLDKLGIRDNTLVIFTSDHGEMLGSQGFFGKGLLLEDAARVPLIMSYPAVIRPGTIVEEPVSHIDIFSTILDYTGAAASDKSDGHSLRRFIERQSYNAFNDERVAVVELDNRVPVTAGQYKFAGSLAPHIMIRKGDYKLIYPLQANSNFKDTLFNLRADPLETKNLLANPMQAPLNVIGKAEHLRALLIEWMRLKDGDDHNFSSPGINLGGEKTLEQVMRRRTWKRVALWKSDSIVAFGIPAWVNDAWTRYEYIYLGRTMPGWVRINRISITGPDAAYFSVFRQINLLRAGDTQRVRIVFRSTAWKPIQLLKAWVVISYGDNKRTAIRISGYQAYPRG